MDNQPNILELKKIDEEFKKRYGAAFAPDGIVNIDSFKKAKYKILWILKETNKCEDLQGYLQCVRQYDKGRALWKRTWSNVIKPSYALLNGVADYNALPSVDVIAQPTMSCVAVINVKKVAGVSIANPQEILSFYEKDKDLLLEQIAAINPDIIISACGDMLGSRLCPEIQNKKTALNLNYKAIMWCHHPNVRSKGFTHEKYFSGIINAAKKQNIEL